MRGLNSRLGTAGAKIAAAFVGAAAVALPCFADTTTKTPVRELIFGIEPVQSERAQTMAWLPLLEHLSVRLGLPVRLATVSDIPAFEACLASKFYDIVFLNPYHYVAAHRRVGYRALARRGDSRSAGLLVVGHNSPIHDLTDLNGRRAAFSAPGAFAASILTSASLDSVGVEVEPVYFQSQDAVYGAVAQGAVAVGGGTPDSFTALDEPTRSALRILHVTQDVAPHTFAVHETLPGGLEAIILDVLTSAGTGSPGLFADLPMTTVVPAQDTDWDGLRAMTIDAAEPQGALQCPFEDRP